MYHPTDMKENKIMHIWFNTLKIKGFRNKEGFPN